MDEKTKISLEQQIKELKDQLAEAEKTAEKLRGWWYEERKKNESMRKDFESVGIHMALVQKKWTI